jgi:hypothetical protein
MNAALHRIALRAVTSERCRQVQLRTEGRIPWSCADPLVSPGERLAVLVEEVGEVARALNDGVGLRDELVQVAAVAVAWIEGLDAEAGEVAA